MKRTRTTLCLLLCFALSAFANGISAVAESNVAISPPPRVVDAMMQSVAEVVESTVPAKNAASSHRVTPSSGMMANEAVDGASVRESAPDSDNPLTLAPTWESWTSPERLLGSIRVVAVMAALSLAPALLLMTTCYVRIVVVLSLLRQALGSQQLPPNQVTTTLAMFLTVLVMWPVWQKVHDDAIEPYTNPEIELSAEDAWTAGVAPIRLFMSNQIRNAKNEEDVQLFLDYLKVDDAKYFSDVPLQALLPAFLISELKVAFAIGFQIFLPFVIVDLVVSSVTMSMGWVMVPPTTISLPLKLMLFVLADGWHLVVEMLLMSFRVVV